MPTYSTLTTIREVMEDKKIVVWKVFDEEKNLLHFFNPVAGLIQKIHSTV